MSLKKIILIFSFLLVGYSDTDAQLTTKNIIVEHFTNTRCGICASRNPGFYTALAQNPDVIHIAYHPSAPYSTCLFSTQNKTQNDARTNFYGLYGGTPTFSINGVEKSSSAVQSANIYNEFKNQTTPVKLDVSLAKYGDDNIEVSFDIKMLANNNIGTVTYFVALVEDTVFYNAPNGEKIHHDVFRKSLTSSTSLPSVNLPQNEGNLLQIRDQIKIESFWDLSRMYAVVVLSDENKSVVQVAKSPLYDPSILSSTDNVDAISQGISIYPNPASQQIFVKTLGDEAIQEIKMFNTAGQEVLTPFAKSSQNTIEITELKNGTYWIQVSTADNTFVQKFIKI